MPELDLDARLGATRTELLDGIQAPELAEIRRRAADYRRRRNARRAGAAVLGLALVGTVVALVQPARGVDRHRPPVAATPTVSIRPEWRGSGLTLLGLTADVADLPGDLYDVLFTDNNRGYALLAQCPKAGPCELAYATTDDSGLTWTRLTPPVSAAQATALPRLVPLRPETLALVGPDAGDDWISHDWGVTWMRAPASSGSPTAVVIGDGRMVLRGGAGGCAAHQVDALETNGSRRPLAEQPPLDACWISPTPAADGSWWVGGVADNRGPAAAVSHDGGATWQRFTFTGPDGSWTKVVPFGSEVYVVVVSGDPGRSPVSVHGLYRSTDQGHTFARYGDPAGVATLDGDLVPLLDGRLVAAAPGWRISTPDGTNFRDGSPDLPWVGRLQRTEAGWVAYDLFGAGWAAFTSDGATWHKIHVR